MSPVDVRGAMSKFLSSERIFGYKDLAIDLYCLSSSLNFYLSVAYEDKINPKKYQQFKVETRVRVHHAPVDLR